MSDIIKVGDQYYVLATSAFADDRTNVLKEGDTFAVFDRYGDITPMGRGEQGLFHEGTRFLSRLELRLGKERPLLLSSTVLDDNSFFTADLTNADIDAGGGNLIKRGNIHLFRQRFLWKGISYERFRLMNYGTINVDITFSILLDFDFTDLFEVRGLKRIRRGEKFPPEVIQGGITTRYKGLDDVERAVYVECDPTPEDITASSATFELALRPREAKTATLVVRCAVGGRVFKGLTYGQASERLVASIGESGSLCCNLHTSNKQFTDVLNRARSDLNMLITQTPHGPYPYAGIPWFSTVFGRDGIITSLEALWVMPDMARGVLKYLAETQSDKDDPDKDAEPGKILHEFRHGEMAAAGEIPYGMYYGSVDSTPLFIMLAGNYYQRTADRDFIASIWPNIERALGWIDNYGDIDKDSFVEYLKRSATGLDNQGWKDSGDSIFHRDGTIAKGPIALAEVQGYVYAAKRHAANLAALMGLPDRADRLRQEARALKRNFEKAFWNRELGTYAIALDGEKRPCLVRGSNLGHCLYSRISEPGRARRVAQMLLSEDFFSGWGIRTLGSSEARYNPMSYHNGSIWPHDNALIAYGMSLYGFKEMALQVLDALFDASLFMNLHRLPELFCGFHRRAGQGPTLYPVACSPQAWSSAAVFMLLKACLGLRIDTPRQQIRFDQPHLPEWLDRLVIEDLKVGNHSVDMLIQRREKDASVNVLKRTGPIEVMILK
ncbi:MAG: amylo-alpha-1,6-glucosidase [Nitrospirota bacterium]